jgi:transcriptional regulator with XRE-family HTH domain
MIRENLKAAIDKSGLFVKEVAAKSNVKKRTIDKWVGSEETEPKVIDLYKVCVVLQTTMEEIVDGKAGAEHVRKVIRNDLRAVQVPDRLFSIVENLLVLDENELRGIRANVEALAEAKKGKGTGMDGLPG